MAKILIDTDCGTDDMFCIGNFIRQHKRNHCKIIGITTVCGNILTEAAFQNTSKLVKEIFEVHDIPIFQSRSSFKMDCLSSFFYGRDGHSGALKEYSNTVYSVPELSSEEFIVQELLQQSDITVVAIGPLTNLHQAEVMRPGILEKAKKLLVMGGNVRSEGNYPGTDFQSEYNFSMDGPAAQGVVAACSKITLFPLDITTSIRFPMNILLKRAREHKRKEFFKTAINGNFEAMLAEGECKTDDKRLNIHDVHTYLHFMEEDVYTCLTETISVDTRGVVYIKENGYVDDDTIVWTDVKVAYSIKDFSALQKTILDIFD